MLGLVHVELSGRHHRLQFGPDLEVDGQIGGHDGLVHEVQHLSDRAARRHTGDTVSHGRGGLRLDTAGSAGTRPVSGWCLHI